jgi:LuxR family maltose regulon positive regulatory protein
MSTNLLTTKLFLPQSRPNLVSRPRLIQRLNEGRDRKFTLVSAPAGFGKTTLLSEWITNKNLQRQTAWVSLDEGDSDPARFWKYFFAALRTVHPDTDQSILDPLNAPQPPPIDMILISLINELVEDSPPVILILDDLQLVSARQIHEGLVFFLDHMPAQMHLVLSSRADPPWPLAHRRVSGEMNELRAADLRFTPDECAIFLNQTMGLNLSAEHVAALEARTEGWIAGLQMVALSMYGRENIDSFIKTFGGSHRFILDYLVEEVLDHQPTEVGEFLLKTSVLERMNASLCAALMGTQPSVQGVGKTRADEVACQRLLEKLDRSNLFLVHLDDERRWFRYHHLFTELLRGRLYQSQPELPPILHRVASDWYQGQGLVDEAIHHALAGDDPERAADLVERNSMQMIVNSRVSRLSSWLEALPDSLVRKRPWLCVYHAWARYYVGPREQVARRLEDAERVLEAKTGTHTASLREAEQRHLAGHIAALRAYIALQNQDLEGAGDYARQALELLPEDDYARGTSAIALAETHRKVGDLVAMEAAYAEARLVAEKCGNLPMAVSATAYMAYQQAKQGYLHKAIETNREALNLAVNPDGRHAPAAGLPYVKMGDILREWDDMESACHCLDEGIRLCRLWGHADALVNGYTHLARVHLAQGDLASARANLRKAEALTRRTAIDPWAICWIDDCRLRLWLAEGDLAAAVHWAQVSGLGIDDELSYIRDLEHVNLARVLVAQGTVHPTGEHLDQALALLDRILAATQAAGWLSRTVEVLILRALAFSAGGETQAALDSLEEALTLAEPAGYVSTFLDEGPPLEKLLRQAVRRGLQAVYLQGLLEAFKRRKADDSQASESIPSGAESASPLVEPLTRREEQVLRLLATDMSAPQIAEQLGVSVTTVRTHIQHIYEKLGAHSRHEATTKGKGLL